MKTFSVSLFCLVLLAQIAYATTAKYRLTYKNDPSTTITIGWNQVSGTTPVVYYGTTDFGTTYASYPNQKAVDRTVSYLSMNNNYARLAGLTPNTVYYFVIKDSQGTSQRFSFKTISSNNNDTLSIISGGDSRTDTPYIGDGTCRSRRQNANRMISKIRPHFVAFDGDMTLALTGSSSSEWSDWFDDWQLTNGTDGRLIPIMVAMGNHESAGDLDKLFDVPTDVYYALSFGGNLLRFYTLNSQITIAGAQTSWLANDINTNYSTHDWMFAQYHEPMRVHSTAHSNRDDISSAWGPLFNGKVRLVAEAHTHTIKETWPMLYTTANGIDSSFVRNDATGTVYIGEGTMGAPLNPSDISYAWTRNAGSFDAFQWIFVSTQKVEIRTIKYGNVATVVQVSDLHPFTLPSGIDIWNPSNGSVVTILNSYGFSISGIITYNNTANTPMNNVSLTLMNGTNIVASTNTNANGSYTFSGIANGSYTIVATSSAAIGGVSATDVLKVKRHIAGLELLTEPIRLTGADVNMTNSITSTDVLKIQRRLAGLDASYLRPDWIFEKQTIGGVDVIVNNSNLTQNFYGLCTGDVNGSFVPVLIAK